jgi:Spy/CpxP family protein refolding chaperone
MWKRFIAVAVVASLGSLAVLAAEPGGPMGAKPAKVEKKARLIQPYSKLTTLADDQRAQIAEIHKKTLAAVKELQAKERADIMALLTADQKVELEKIEEAAMVQQKLKDGKAKEAAPTTAPAKD